MAPTQALFLAALNHLLNQAPWARNSAAQLATQAIQVKVLGISTVCTFNDEGHLVATQDEAKVLIELPLLLLLRLSMGDASARFDIPIQGDVQLAHQFSLVLNQLSWDIEADLAHFFGDGPAHLISQAAQHLIQWKNLGTMGLAKAGVEFATQEIALLAHRQALTNWTESIDALRDAEARLSQRVDILIAQLATRHSTPHEN